MKFILKIFLVVFLFIFNFGTSISDDHNVLQILETLKQDIKTLERAVYSDSFEKKK